MDINDSQNTIPSINWDDEYAELPMEIPNAYACSRRWLKCWGILGLLSSGLVLLWALLMSIFLAQEIYTSPLNTEEKIGASLFFVFLFGIALSPLGFKLSLSMYRLSKKIEHMDSRPNKDAFLDVLAEQLTTWKTLGIIMVINLALQAINWIHSVVLSQGWSI